MNLDDNRFIGVVGLGLMGTSIDAHLLNCGHQVIAITNEPASIKAIQKRIASHLQNLEKYNMLNQDFQLSYESFFITDDYASLSKCTIVIESITENPQAKKKVYGKVEQVVSINTIIATNTSALPISLLQQGLKYPKRFLGVHWAEPAHITKFMEIICGEQTGVSMASDLKLFAEKYWYKEPALLLKDIRGFLANRLMYALIREAFYLVENGYASVQDIDRVLRNDIGSWITFAGPFRFMDITGLYPSYAAMPELLPTLCNDVTMPATLTRLVKEGANGLTTAGGFYHYTPESAKKWDKLFAAFSNEIKKISDKYPENAGDI